MTKAAQKKPVVTMAVQPKSKTTTALKNLFLSDKNVRQLREVSPQADEKLDASIFSFGLFQNLSVIEEMVDGKATGRLGVIAGGRRLESLKRLLADNKIDDNYSVDISIYDEADAREVSALENSTQEVMHPYDEFVAYQAMIEEGSTIESIAGRHGVKNNYVNSRLRLASASPKILEEFKKGSMDIEQLMMLCLTTDHNKQESTWFDAPHWQKTPESLRRVVTTGEVSVQDKKVIFVGLENYINRGGQVRSDLFHSNDTVIDIGLLNTMVDERLTEEAEVVKAEGWKWVKFTPEYDYGLIQQYSISDVVVREKLTKEEEVTKADLETRLVALSSKEEADDFEYDEEFQKEEEALMAEEDAFQNSLQSWCSDIAEMGVIIYVGDNGKLVRKEGFLEPSKRVKKGDDVSNNNKETDTVERKGYPQTLIDSLLGTRTIAMQVELSKNTNVVLALLAEKMIFSIMPNYEGTYGLNPITSEFKNYTAHQNIPDYDETEVAKQKYALFEKWQKVLPNDKEKVFDWLLGIEQEQLLEIIAFFTSLSVQFSHFGADKNYQKLANLINLDVTEYYTPSFENFYKKLSVGELVALAKENKKKIDGNTEKMSRKQVATIVSEQMEGVAWLPQQVKVFKGEATKKAK